MLHVAIVALSCLCALYLLRRLYRAIVRDVHATAILHALAHRDGATGATAMQAYNVADQSALMRAGGVDALFPKDGPHYVFKNPPGSPRSSGSTAAPNPSPAEVEAALGRHRGRK